MATTNDNIGGDDFKEFEDILVQDYERAQITFFYLRKPNELTRRLIFGVIYLSVTGSRDWPSDNPYKKLKGGSGYEVNLMRFSVSVKKALEIYHQFRSENHATVETNEFISDKSRKNEIVIESAKLGEEPPWPNFLAEDGTFWKSASFWGNQSGGIRRHQLLRIENNGAFLDLADAEMKECFSWIKKYLPVELEERTVLHGSVHFVLANPIIRIICEKLNENKELQFRILVYPGKDLRGLKMIVHNSRPTGLASVVIVEEILPVTRIIFDFEPFEIGYEIIHETRGVICSSKPVTFIKSIAFSGSLITGKKKVSLPATSKKRREKNYEAQVVGHILDINVGEKNSPSALNQVLLDQRMAEKKAEEMRSGTKWLNNVEEAEEIIRDLIKLAKKSIFIVDPYFGAIELLRFSAASAPINIKTKILTSEMYLINITNGILNWDSLKKNIDFNSKALGTGLEVRVMPGKRPSIHDRFILIDRDLWHLGSSLNELGARGSLLFKVQNEESILEHLNLAWDDSEPLLNFIAGQSEAEKDERS